MANKFVVYGQSRSGSTLLVELLNSGPGIHCDGELFNTHWKYIDNAIVADLVKRFPVLYMAYHRRRAAAEVYGFKLLFYQIRYTRYWLRLMHLAGWKFVHIQRRNVLEQALSRLIANRTKRFHRRDGDPTPDHCLEITPDGLRQELVRRMEWTRREHELIAPIPRLDIYYEDDLRSADAWPRTVARVCEHLGIPAFEPGAMELKRGDERPYREVISNYDELVDSLKGTEFARYVG